MKENILKDKSYKFALRIIALYKYLIKNKESTAADKFYVQEQLLEH